MTATPALVSARPWTNSGAIASLFDSAVAATAIIGERQFRIIPEQLVRMRDGHREQPIRVLGDSEAIATASVSARVNGGKAISESQRAGDDSVRLFVPAVADAVTVLVTIEIPDGSASVEVPIAPVRDWEIHVVHHSHLDIGYTDRQPVALQHQRSYLDSVVDLMRSTVDAPDESRFRWAVEAIYTVADWMRHRPSTVVDEFMEYVRQGRIELSALPFNLHTDACSTAELHELVRTAKELSDRYGLVLDTAMQTDVPGTVVGLPAVLHDAGVRYLSVAHNWAGRSTPQLLGGQLLPRLFRWADPAGKSVLVWMTDSPHGMAYTEGPLLGFADSYELVLENLPVYLQSLANNPYPYPPGVFGWHGTAPAADRQPYPWDFVHLRTQGWIADNAPARLQAARIVEEWNAEWASPRLRLSTNREFFEVAEQRLGDSIQTYTGDWGDWWVEGIGSAAYAEALIRDAQFRAEDAGIVAAIRVGSSGQPIPGAADEGAELYRSIALFDEHTWGAGNSWMTADSGDRSGEAQWQWKVAKALEAQEDGVKALERASAFLSSDAGTADGALASVVVVNTRSRGRSGAARLFLRESLIPFDQPFRMVDSRTGAELPYRSEPQENLAFRESGRFVNVDIDDVPPLGWVRLDAIAGEPRELVSSVRQGTVLENDHIRVEVDLARSCISSIVDLHSGEEVLNTDSLFGANEYIYDRYTSGPAFNHQSNRTSTSKDLEMLGSRDRAKPAVLLEHTRDDVEERLVYEYPAPGADWVRVTVRLGARDRHVVFENRIAKPSTRVKESAYFAFPFAPRDRVRFEVTGGVVGDGLEHVPGAPEHLRGIRTWAALDGDGPSISWVTRDVPLVQRGSIAIPYAPFPASTSPIEPATVISWVHNNVWDTNFPIEQAFETTFSYAIGVGAETEDGTQAALAASDRLIAPLLGMTASHPTAPPAAATWSLLTVDDDRVSVIGAVTDDDGGVLLRLQSFSEQAVEVGLTLSSAIESAEFVSLIGADPRPLPIGPDSHVAVPIAPFGVAGVLVRLRSGEGAE